MFAMFAALALSGDVFVATTVPSAVPMSDGSAVQAELSGFGGAHKLLFSDTELAGGAFRVAADVGDRVRIGGRVGGYWSRERRQPWFVFGINNNPQERITERLTPDVSVDLSVAVLNTDQVRLNGFAVVGTYAQAGVAFWWGDKKQRWSVDAAYGPAIRVGAVLGTDDDKASLTWDIRHWTPEAGVTVGLGADRQHAIRLGLVSAIPTLGYRYDAKRAYVKVTAGTLVVTHVAQAVIGIWI